MTSLRQTLSAQRESGQQRGVAGKLSSAGARGACRTVQLRLAPARRQLMPLGQHVGTLPAKQQGEGLGLRGVTSGSAERPVQDL